METLSPKSRFIGGSRSRIRTSLRQMGADELRMHYQRFNHQASYCQPMRADETEKTAPVKPSTKKAPRKLWTAEEDARLQDVVQSYGESKFNWVEIADYVGNGRTGKKCRDRWYNHLRPDIKKGDWSKTEEAMIENLYSSCNQSWSTMAKKMPNRTENDIKNKWNSMQRSRRRREAKEKKKQSSHLASNRGDNRDEDAFAVSIRGDALNLARSPIQLNRTHSSSTPQVTRPILSCLDRPKETMQHAPSSSAFASSVPNYWQVSSLTSNTQPRITAEDHTVYPQKVLPSEGLDHSVGDIVGI